MRIQPPHSCSSLVVKEEAKIAGANVGNIRVRVCLAVECTLAQLTASRVGIV